MVGRESQYSCVLKWSMRELFAWAALEGGLGLKVTLGCTRDDAFDAGTVVCRVASDIAERVRMRTYCDFGRRGIGAAVRRRSAGADCLA